MLEARIEIPLDPPRECSANARSHWAQRARAVRLMRAAAGWAAMPAAGTFRLYEHVPTQLTAEIGWSKGRRRQDPTNLPHLLKPIIDGISDVLWHGRDDHVHLSWITQKRDPDGRGYVRVWLRTDVRPLEEC